jgi:hypothetical protein
LRGEKETIDCAEQLKERRLGQPSFFVLDGWEAVTP